MIGLLLALMLSPTIGTDFAPLTNNCIAPRVAVDLAGPWELSTDGKNWKNVRIPCRNRVDADVVHHFRRTFTTPKGWKTGDRALVNFEVIGYEYEVFECKRCIEEGLGESPLMPHAETLAIMRQMDALRKEWGVHYPAD